MDRDKKRGLFITFEGIDGAGTTTQAALLHETLEATFDKCLLTREPSDGPVGMLIRQILSGRLLGSVAKGDATPFDRRSLALLFAADRIDHLASEVLPAIRQGIQVVSDRYLLSSLAYQSLDSDETWVLEINKNAPRPDITILLEVQVDEALGRLAACRSNIDIFEKKQILEKVAANYKRFTSKVGGMVKIVNGQGTVEQVRRAVWNAISPLLSNKKLGAGS
ncbi:MAG: dTMP kinase [Deltaproteobacteria bacterium]|nr:dTMP kinase [Deltaproteobacteria bacterium]